MRRMLAAAPIDVRRSSRAREARAAGTALPTALPFAAECLSTAPGPGSRAARGRFLSLRRRRARVARHRECGVSWPAAKRGRQPTEVRAVRLLTGQPRALGPLADCTRARIVHGAPHFVVRVHPRLRAPAGTRVVASPAQRVDPPKHLPPRDAAIASAP